MLQQFLTCHYGINIEICPKLGVCKFPTEVRWLKGEEYGFLIRHYYAYAKVISLFEMNDRMHPIEVYRQPQRK